MKRITTTEEFDNNGKLIKRTMVEETDAALSVSVPDNPLPWYGPQWTNIPLRVDCGNTGAPRVSYQDQTTALGDRPDYHK